MVDPWQDMLCVGRHRRDDEIGIEEEKGGDGRGGEESPGGERQAAVGARRRRGGGGWRRVEEEAAPSCLVSCFPETFLEDDDGGRAGAD